MADTAFTDGVTLTAAAWFNDVNSATYNVLSSVAGTNTITATGPSTYTAYATRPLFVFIPAVTNTGATTINITPSGGAALGAKNIFAYGAALNAGELKASVPVVIMYDGTQFNIVGPYFGTVTTLVTTCSGYASDPAVTVSIMKIANRVFLTISGFTGTSDSVAKTLAAPLPAAYRPATAHFWPVQVNDGGGAGVTLWGVGEIATDGTVNFYATAANGSWTASGTAPVSRSSTDYSV